jgi:hypothetical protein
MADYRDRLRSEITLTSPLGDVFNALWSGDESNHVKKIGIFNYFGVAGSTVQDGNIRSATYPLTIQFSGPDNDLEAIRFVKALSETGTWEVVHPMLGLKKLQPMSVTPDWQPITSGNITTVATEWIEPLDSAVVASTPELQAGVAAQTDVVNETASDQLNETTFQKTAAEIAEFRAAVNDVVANVDIYLEGIASASAAITAEIKSIKRDVDAVLAVVPLDMIAVAGQIQALIQLPARAIQDTRTRLDAYQNLADGLTLSLTPETPGTPSYNRVSVQEAALTATFGAVAYVASTGALLSRSEAVGIIEAVGTLFRDATDVLDASQALFNTQALGVQYFSQSQSYSDSALLIAKTLAYLLRASFDLKVEKRFVLTAPANPLRIAIREYGEAGEGDANINLFNETNNIEDGEFLVMQAGRELVVYV